MLNNLVWAILAAAHSKRIVAIGDIHGDYEAFTRILVKTELFDWNLNWVGKDTALVQVGDILDRGADTIKIYKLLRDIHFQSKLENFEFHVLLGNHEILNMMNRDEYVSKEEYLTFARDPGVQRFRNDLEVFLVRGDRQSAFMKDGWIGKLIRGPFSKTAVVIGDSVFTHAGILPRFAENGIDYLNAFVWKLIEKESWKHEVFGHDGPFWTRNYARGSEKDICSDLLIVLRQLNVKRMVVGHSITESGKIETRCRGRLVFIDVGISKAFGMGGNCAALEISNDRLTALYCSETSQQIKRIAVI